MFAEIAHRLKSTLSDAGVSGIVVTTPDNVSYLSGYESVMDGWRLPEPISAVFLPTSDDLPMTLFLPEASLIGLVVAEREGHAVAFDRLRTFDLLNFCATARSEDVHLALAPDLLADLGRLRANDSRLDRRLPEAYGRDLRACDVRRHARCAGG